MKRIAVVEDEVYMREELCNMLQKDGYLAEAITELEDAARLLAESFPAFHQFLLPGPQFFHSLGQLQRFLIVAGSLRIAEPAGQLGGFPV